jgi:hypothetical protein
MLTTISDLKKMKHCFIFLLVFLLIMSVFGQTLDVQIGPSFSKSKWENLMMSNHTLLNDKVIGTNASLGIEYWDNTYFNLSSSLGFIQKGGKDSIQIVFGPPEPIPLTFYKLKLNYVTFNTCAIVKIPFRDVIIPYLLAGPRIDYLVSYKEDVPVIKGYEDVDKVNCLSYGFITGAGIKYKLDKIQVGVVFNYLINLNNLVDFKWTSDGPLRKFSDNTFSLNFQIGHKL